MWMTIESSSFEIMKILKNKKIYFDYNDPYFTSIRKEEI